MEPEYCKSYRVDNRSDLPATVLISKLNNFPLQLSRLCKRKMEYFIRCWARPHKGQRILELFGGTCLGTALIAQRLATPLDLTSIDIRFSRAGTWRYAFNENYQHMAQYYHLKSPEITPTFLGMNAKKLSFTSPLFHMVIAADSPRGATNEYLLPLSDALQRELFVKAAHESFRVLKLNGVFVATCRQSWVEDLKIFPKVETSFGPPKVRFPQCDDPVVYVRAIK